MSTIVALYLNLSAVFLAFGHHLFGARRILRDRRFLRAWVIAYAIIVVLFVPSLWGVAQWSDRSNVPEPSCIGYGRRDRPMGVSSFSPTEPVGRLSPAFRWSRCRSELRSW